MEAAPYLVPHSREPIRILYRDADLLLVRKPDLLLSIPGRHPLNRDCLISRLQKDYPTASIVHRLDLDTSGIMVIPLNRETHAHISRQFQQRRVEKSYEAKLEVANANITSLVEQVTDLRTRLDKADNLVTAANERVTAIATSALKAGADAATVARVSEIAAGGQKK